MVVVGRAGDCSRLPTRASAGGRRASPSIVESPHSRCFASHSRAGGPAPTTCALLHTLPPPKGAGLFMEGSLPKGLSLCGRHRKPCCSTHCPQGSLPAGAFATSAEWQHTGTPLWHCRARPRPRSKRGVQRPNSAYQRRPSILITASVTGPKGRVARQHWAWARLGAGARAFTAKRPPNLQQAYRCVMRGHWGRASLQARVPTSRCAGDAAAAAASNRTPTLISGHRPCLAKADGPKSTAQCSDALMLSILTQADLPDKPAGARCVQGLDGSRWLQIALVFAIRYALHRHESRVIRCQQLYSHWLLAGLVEGPLLCDQSRLEGLPSSLGDCCRLASGASLPCALAMHGGGSTSTQVSWLGRSIWPRPHF